MPDDEAAEPLGRRLDLVARSIAARLRQTYPWVGLLVPVLDRMTALDQQHQSRFDRHETEDRPLQVRARRGPAAEGPADHSAVASPKRGRPLPADVRAPLRDLTGDGVDRLRVHDDSEAEAIARAHGSDAVTVGVDVFFRGGRYQPDERRGRALIAHEATHVAAARGSTESTGSHDNADRLVHEESHARLVERAALGAVGDTGGVNGQRSLPHSHSPTLEPGGPVLTAPPWRGPGPGATVVTPAGDGPTRPGAAARSTAPMSGLESAASPATAVPAARRADADRPLPAPPAGVDVAALREAVVSDVMRRLRVESERGG